MTDYCIHRVTMLIGLCRLIVLCNYYIILRGKTNEKNTSIRNAFRK